MAASDRHGRIRALVPPAAQRSSSRSPLNRQVDREAEGVGMTAMGLVWSHREAALWWPDLAVGRCWDVDCSGAEAGLTRLSSRCRAPGARRSGDSRVRACVGDDRARCWASAGSAGGAWLLCASRRRVQGRLRLPSRLRTRISAPRRSIAPPSGLFPEMRVAAPASSNAIPASQMRVLGLEGCFSVVGGSWRASVRRGFVAWTLP